MGETANDKLRRVQLEADQKRSGLAEAELDRSTWAAKRSTSASSGGRDINGNDWSWSAENPEGRLKEWNVAESDKIMANANAIRLADKSATENLWKSIIGPGKAVLDASGQAVNNVTSAILGAVTIESAEEARVRAAQNLMRRFAAQNASDNRKYGWIETEYASVYVGTSSMAAPGSENLGSAALDYLQDGGYLDVRADQMQFEVGKQLPAAFLVASVPPISLKAFIGGALAGGTINSGAQYVANDSINWLDVGSASLTGGMTFGKGFAPSAAVNGYGAHLTAEIKGEDSRWKVAGAVVGTGLGGWVGGLLERQALQLAIPAAIVQYRGLTDNLIRSALPLNILGSGMISETTNYYTDKVPATTRKK